MFADKEMQLRTETVRHIRGQENDCSIPHCSLTWRQLKLDAAQPDALVQSDLNSMYSQEDLRYYFTPV